MKNLHKLTALFFLLFPTMGMVVDCDVKAQDLVSVTTVMTPYESGSDAYLKFLDRAAVSVRIAIFGFTDPRITNKLIDLKNRGVDVRLVMDASQAKGTHERPEVARLKEAGIDVVIGTSCKRHQLQHCKFTVIDGEWVEDGSWNYSLSADNQDNYLNFIQSKQRAARFADFWQKMHDYIVSCEPQS